MTATNSGRLSGACAIVTGATSGIGRAIVGALVGAGCKVVATGRNEERLQQVANEFGSAVNIQRLDLADAAAIAQLPAALSGDFARPTILVNNAGEDVGGRTRFDSSTADELARVIEINLVGVIRMVRAFVPAMLEREQGDIVNIGSTQAIRVAPSLAAYTASKTGVHGLTDVLRADYSKTGIRVMEVVPGLTRTGFAQSRWRGDAEKAKAYFDKFDSSLDPADVADAVLYALTRPRHVNVQQMVVTPAWQW